MSKKSIDEKKEMVPGPESNNNINQLIIIKL